MLDIFLLLQICPRGFGPPGILASQVESKAGEMVFRHFLRLDELEGMTKLQRDVSAKGHGLKCYTVHLNSATILVQKTSQSIGGIKVDAPIFNAPNL